MKIKYERLEEVNILFETIKTILLTGLSQAKINGLLDQYTHYEIRNWKFVDWKFIITDLIMHNWFNEKE